jgi:hypothetical protein
MSNVIKHIHQVGNISYNYDLDIRDIDNKDIKMLLLVITYSLI